MSIPLSFTPVKRQRGRNDGWTAEKQRDFIAALAECGIVSMAAERVGMNRISAYKLRQAEGAAEFAQAWEEAQRHSFGNLQDIAMERVLNGVAIPHFYNGEQVGERRWFDNRLLMFMLRQTRTRRFGPFAAEIDFSEMLTKAAHAEAAKKAGLLQRLRSAEESYDAMIQSEMELPAEERYPDLDDWTDGLDEIEGHINKLSEE